MAVNLLKDENFLVITREDGSNHYFNAGWCTMKFRESSVVISDKGRSFVGTSEEIAFSDFQYDSVSYNTETAIFGILKDKIG